MLPASLADAEPSRDLSLSRVIIVGFPSALIIALAVFSLSKISMGKRSYILISNGGDEF